MKSSIIQQKSYEFASRIVKAYKFLANEQREYVLSKQLLRSGNSIGANVEEALAASSTANFVHKLNIAAKEARETSYWLRLLRDNDFLPNQRSNPFAPTIWKSSSFFPASFSQPKRIPTPNYPQLIISNS